MSGCDRYSFRVMLHLDKELDADEQRLVEAHLASCRACRGSYNRERLFREGIRRRSPLHVAPDDLRARVRTMVYARHSTQVDGEAGMGMRSRRRAGLLRRFGAVAAAAGLVAIVGSHGLSNVLLSPVEAASFPTMAVDVHQRHQRGQLPLELTTDAAQDVTRWLAGKVPFVVTLPDYQESSRQDTRYEIRGARLVGFNGGYAAYVAYQMEQQPISLVITSTSIATPAGGQTISSKGIAFHFETIEGIKVVTWSHRNLTYALVSNLTERGQNSCLVCHQGADDRDVIDGLAFLHKAPANVADNFPTAN